MHTAEHTPMRIPLEVPTPPADALLVALQRDTTLRTPTLTPDGDGIGRNREDGSKCDDGGEVLHFVRLFTST